MLKKITLMLAVAGLAACEAEQGGGTISVGEAVKARPASTSRWYSAEQVAAGGKLFAENCAACHGRQAEGTADWKKLDENGNLPPPPLNGTAHAWHHSLGILRGTIKRGGAPVGGTMPAFGQKFSDAEIDSILAWIQSHWSDRIYEIWSERDRATKSGLQPIK